MVLLAEERHFVWNLEFSTLTSLPIALLQQQVQQLVFRAPCSGYNQAVAIPFPSPQHNPISHSIKIPVSPGKHVQMEDWIFDRRLLRVGLIRIDPRAVTNGLANLNSQFRNWKRSDTHANRVLTYDRHFKHTLLYHRPFIESAFDYDVCNSLRFVGVTPEHYAELRYFMEGMVFRHRKLWANWNSNNIRYSFNTGYFRLLNDEDYLLPLEGNWFSVGGYGGSSSVSSTPVELDLSAAFHKTFRAIDDPRIKPLIRHDYKAVSLSSSLDLLDFLIDEISDKCCPLSHYQLTIDLMKLKDSPHAPDIWHIWQNNWFAPKGFDRYALPKDPFVVRAYPIINVMSTNESYGLDYALNVVHVRGESFVEVQAYECPELLQMTADVSGCADRCLGGAINRG